jgi:hypothetical protein
MVINTFIHRTETFENTIKPLLDQDNFTNEIMYIDKQKTPHESITIFLCVCKYNTTNPVNILKMKDIPLVIQKIDGRIINRDNSVDLWWFRNKPNIIYAVNKSNNKLCSNYKKIGLVFIDRIA